MNQLHSKTRGKLGVGKTLEKLSNDKIRNELAKYIAKSAGEKLNAI